MKALKKYLTSQTVQVFFFSPKCIDLVHLQEVKSRRLMSVLQEDKSKVLSHLAPTPFTPEGASVPKWM